MSSKFLLVLITLMVAPLGATESKNMEDDERTKAITSVIETLTPIEDMTPLAKEFYHQFFLNSHAFKEGSHVSYYELGNTQGAFRKYEITTDSGFFTVYNNNSLEVHNYIPRKRDLLQKHCYDIDLFTQHLKACGIKVQSITKY